MTDSQKIRIAVILIIAEAIMLAMTLGFKTIMDIQAERHGISTIIENAGE